MIRGSMQKIKLRFLKRKRQKVTEKLHFERDQARAKYLFEELTLLDSKIEKLVVASRDDTLENLDQTAAQIEEEKEGNQETDNEGNTGKTEK